MTLVELLVVISLVGLLTSIALPAVQRVREAARRMQCSNSLRQFGLAMHAFHEQSGTFPPNGFFRPNSDRRVRYDYAPHVWMLPYLEQSSVFNAVNFETGLNTPHSIDPVGTRRIHATVAQKRIELFLCPADPAPANPGNNYRVNIGTGPVLYTGSAYSDNGAFWWSGLRSAEFTDGLSHTVAMSEKLRGDCTLGRYSPAADWHFTSDDSTRPYDELVRECAYTTLPAPPYKCDGGKHWLFAGTRDTWYTHGLQPNSEIADCAIELTAPPSGLFTARSFHPGGVNALMTDGNVRFVSDAIDRLLWRSLGTRNGSETVDSATW